MKGTTRLSNLQPEFRRIRETAEIRPDLPDTLHHAITQGYLSVFAFVDGLRAIPVSRARRKGEINESPSMIDILGDNEGWRVTEKGRVAYEGPGYRLKGYWQILNDPESESCDASIHNFARAPDSSQRIGYLYRSSAYPELPGSDSLILVDDLKVKFGDLFIRMSEVFDRATNGTALAQIERHAGNEAEMLRAALSILSNDTVGYFRFTKSKKVNAAKLAEAVMELDSSWWTEGACPLSQKVCAEKLADIVKGERRKK